jgi:hypothetical protein
MSLLSGKPEKEQRQTKMSVCFTFYKISAACIYLISRFWFIFEITMETFIFWWKHFSGTFICWQKCFSAETILVVESSKNEISGNYSMQ